MNIDVSSFWIDTPIAGDDIVNASEVDAVTVSGTSNGIDDGRTVTVTFTDGANSVEASATITNGIWTANAVNLSGLDQGAITVTAQVVDQLGNPLSAEAEIQLDTLAPDDPSQYLLEIHGYQDNVAPNEGTFEGGTSTDDTSPLLMGQVEGLEPGDVVKICEGTELLGQATVTGDSWTFQLQNVPDGEHSYHAVIVDAAGNHGLRSDELTFMVDTDAPKFAPTIDTYTDDAGGLMGEFGNGSVTDDTSPTLNGTVPQALDGGEQVIVYRVIGAETVKVGTAIMDAEGTAWTLRLENLTDGTHYQYVAKIVDPAGNVGPLSETFEFSVDTTGPSNAAFIESFEDDVGLITGPSFASGTTTDDSAPLLHGTLQSTLTAGDMVQIYKDGQLLGNAETHGGSWTYQLSDLSDGQHSFTAIVTDAAGNPSASGFSDEFIIIVSTRASVNLASIESYLDNTGLYKGIFASGTTTDDTSPQLHGTLDTALADGEVVRIYDGTTLLGTAVVTGTSWTYQLNGLADGVTYSYTAVVASVSGVNGVASSPFTITIDTTPPDFAPTLTGYADDMGSLTGNFGNGSRTDDTTPLLQGTVPQVLADGETVRVYKIVGSEQTLVGIAQVDGMNWTFQLNGLVDNTSYTYVARVVDAAGNEGGNSNTLSFTVDTHGPDIGTTIDTYTDNAGKSTGNFTTGTTTDDTTPKLNGSLTSSLNPGDIVQIYQDGVKIGNALVAGGNWSFQLDTLTDGTYTFKAVVTDAAGNLSSASFSPEFTITVDTSTPDITSSITFFTDDVGRLKGDFPSGSTTDDRDPVLQGVLSDPLLKGESVRVYSGSTLLGEAVVNGTTWTFALSDLQHGETYHYTSVVTSSSGMEGNPSDDFTLTVDTLPPTGTITVNTLATGDTTPTITGTVNGIDRASGEKVWVKVNGVLYKEGEEDQLVVIGNTWTLHIDDQHAINVNGKSDALLNVEAWIVDPACNTKGDGTINEVTIFRDIAVIDAPNKDYVAELQPGLMGTGRINGALGEKLVVEVYDQLGTLLKKFDSSTGDVTLNDATGSWRISGSKWGSTQLESGKYTVKSYVELAGGNTGGQVGEDATFTVVKPEINKAVTNSGDDTVPQVYALADGGYWLFYVACPTVGNTNLYAQRYTQSGVAVGDKVTIADSAFTDGYSYGSNLYYIRNYDVHMNDNGTFSVFWSSNNSTVPYIRNFDADGKPKGAAEPVQNSFNYELTPTYVAMDDGSYVLLYASGDTFNYNVYQIRYDKDGTALDKDPVALTTGVNQGHGFTYTMAGLNGQPTGGAAGDCTQGLSSASLGGNYYVVQYMSSKANGTANVGTEMYLQVYDFETGKKVGAEINANAESKFYQIGAKVVALKEGGFISTWASNHSSKSGAAGTMDDFNVYARRFKWDADSKQIVALDPNEVMVNTSTDGVNGVYFNHLNVHFDVAALEHGGYVVVWSKFISATQSEVYGQTFDAAGNKLGGETLISVNSGDRHDLVPSVTALLDGGYVVAWANANPTAGLFNQTGDVHTIIVNADGTIRGSGDSTHYPTTASYLDGSGVLIGDDAVNTLDGRHGATELRAGGGHDFIIVKDTDFTFVDGGAGNDTLIWDSTADLNLADIASKVANIEIIHLGDEHANTLTLSLDEVLGLSTTTDSVIIQGGFSDKVVADSTWINAGSQTWQGESYQVYVNQLSETASMWIQQGVDVNLSDDMKGTTGNDRISDTAADNVIEAGAGNDCVSLAQGGKDTVMYRLLDAIDKTGGNGEDEIVGFTVGILESTPDADRIALSELLQGYTPSINGSYAATYVDGTATIAEGDAIVNYLRTEIIDDSTRLYIDMHGTGNFTSLLTLNGVQTDLATLLANHQITLI